jgi:CheY-like chemotaxis protein
MRTRSNLNILLAEDNPINQKIALIFLRKLGHNADLANNGQDVLLALECRTYDLVLMDIQMPEMDGIEATKMIRERFSHGPKIIVVTAFSSSSFRKLCMDAGADDFINKPVKIEELRAAIERNMGDRALQCLRLPDIDGQVQDLDNMGHAI